MMMTTARTQTIPTLGLTGLGLLTMLLPLAAQESGKKATESGDRAAQEYRQTLEATAAAQEVQEVQKEDSLRRLIHELDLGSSNPGGAARPANRALQSLGSLMIPALLAELDDLGPFGLMNASKLLANYPDESLGTLVERYLKDPSPARQAMAAGLLASLKPAVRRSLYPLALASKRDKVRLDGLHAMMSLGIGENEILREMGRIFEQGGAATKATVVQLLISKGLRKTDEGRVLFQEATRDSDALVRSRAVEAFIRSATPKDEDDALDLLKGLRKEDRKSLYDHVTGRQLVWPRVLIAALEIQDRNLNQNVMHTIRNTGVRLTKDQVHLLLTSEDTYILDFILSQLRGRQQTIEDLKPVLALIDHPNQSVSRSAVQALAELDPRLLLESGRFEDLGRVDYTSSNQMHILRRASPGHWSKEMFSLWKAMEDYEALNPAKTRGSQKRELAELMAKTLDIRDWPLLQTFLLTAFEDPRLRKRRRDDENRADLVEQLFAGGYFVPELQVKALRLVPSTTKKIALEIFNQISEALVPGEPRPELEDVLFQLLAEPSEQKGDPLPAVRRHTYPRDEILDSAFQLLRGLPSSKRDAELLAFVKSSVYEVAFGASDALLARSKERIQVFEAMLASPHAYRLILRVLDRPELAKVSQLRKKTIDLLQADMLLEMHMVYAPAGRKLEAFLYNLGREERTQLLIDLLGKLPRGLDVRVTSLLLERLGDSKDERHLTIFAPFLEDRSERVRLAAVEAIGKTFSPKAAPYLLESLKDDGTSEMARAYLQKIDEYLQEKAKWEKRFSGRKPSTPRPGLPSGPSRTKK